MQDEERGAATLLATQSAPASADALANEGRRPFARITSFEMTHDGLGCGFSDTAVAIDNLFRQHVLPKAARQPGFLDCQRMIDAESGECVVISYWETEKDCTNSFEDSAYYHDGLGQLRKFARYGMIKTEHCKLWTVYPNDRDIITSPYVRLTKLELDLPSDNVGEVVARVDSFFQHEVTTKAPPGFLGAQRLVGIGDSKGMYYFLSHWDSVGTLRGSTRGTPHYDIFNGQFSTVEQPGSGIRQFAKPGTDTSTHNFEHLHYEKARIVPTFFEEGSFRAAVFQLACISLGVGIFTMPMVFSSVGFVSGMGLLLMFAVLSDFSIQLMLQAAWMTGAETYEDVLGVAFGRGGRLAALASIAVSTWTANCAHMQFTASMFVTLQGDGGGYLETVVGSKVKVQTFAAMLQFCLIALPLSLKRRLNDLRHVSLVVVMFSLFVSCVVFAKSCGLIVSHGASNNVPFKSVGFGDMLDIAPVACFGFSSIAEVFSVRAEVKEKAKLGQAAHIATAIVSSIYLGVGLIGSMAIESPSSNILLDFDKNRFISLLMLGLCVVITMLYPLINFPAVGALDALCAEPGAAPSIKRRRIFTAILLVSTLTLDTAVSDLGLIFGLCGSLGLGLLAYVLPTAAFLGLSGRNALGHTSWIKVVLAAFVLFIGLGMTIGSTARIIYSTMDPKRHT